MDATLTPTLRRIPVRGNELSIREWAGSAGGRDFLLVHGLSSNACTWDGVGAELSGRGHHVVAVDQRGHGRSDKPDTGYGFDEVTADLDALITALGLQRTIVAGQSWGGNVVVEFAARYPGALAGLIMVDGGFIDLASAPGATWEEVSVSLKPPPLAGLRRDIMLERMTSFHPDWDSAQLEMQMANFEALPDGTIRPWLTLDRHMQILRALFDQKPPELFPRVPAPTLIAAAPAPSPDRQERKEYEVSTAMSLLPNARLRWYNDSVHDIHVDQPDRLAGWFLEALEEGFFG
jgi:pimeloyl-ACP methyl ester carboxylesterase